jgi:histidinol phosphatase-like enzyme (inositol monophosphatase family)
MPQLNRSQAEEFLAFAHRLADAAAQVTLAHFRTPIAVDNKHASGFDPVTAADRGAETAIRALIEKTYPGHGILGEEHGRKPSRDGFTWVIDPVDGTRSFITGSPLWGTLIALNDGERAVVGMLDQPFMKERFWGVSIAGWREAGFTRDGARSALATRACAALSDAVLSTTTLEMFKEGERRAFERLMKEVRLTRFGGDCYQYGLAAMGFMDLVVETGLAPYDIQALIPILEGAGGAVTTWDGGAAESGGRIVAAGDARAHAAALEILSASAVP